MEHGDNKTKKTKKKDSSLMDAFVGAFEQAAKSGLMGTKRQVFEKAGKGK